MTACTIGILAKMSMWKSGLEYQQGTGHGIGSYLSTHEVQTFRISFEQSPKKAKQDHVNGKTNGKARESDVIDVEFEEFCKAFEANLSIEQMVEILEVNDKDSSSPNPVVVTKCKDMLFYGPLGRCPICNSKLEFDVDKKDSCGEDCVEAVTVEKAGECLSFPRYVVGETKLEASKEGHTLKDFKYGCFDHRYTWTRKIHQLIRWIKKQNCPSVLGLRLDNALTSTANQLIPPTPATYTLPVEQPEVADLSEHLSKHCLARWMKWLVNQWSNVA
ncbi:hypothetical protein Patl1_24109 [Pistacia atlantica]|uniref:Uncharacterized protein n=1 Tax=Pistacia atlantica TaxID=434234 RepID=A0ACC0ZXV9_9ROSI|nr:hypothetical protein Patl1_24109 [Pistacia atlantica]